ncbi:MAG: hypothetical protein MUE60_13050 [Candidatus Eisenbacteria bacterium]|nr:hypothetical protein [Candidatus Eisenbacteria bacterium]
MTENLALTIDLAAELRKIAERQHLNDVHFLVQLVRHAMRHLPSSIDIVSSSAHVAVRQDGLAFPRTERDLILSVLGGDDPAQQQRVLEALEREHGTSILSLALLFSRVEVSSEDWTLVAERGRGKLQPRGERRPGYQIAIRRINRARNSERKEIAFFCAGASVPIRYNGKAVNLPSILKGQVLVSKAEDSRGRGMLGIPLAGRLSTVSFLKQGIRFGFRRFLDPDGYVVEGLWDAHDSSFEPTYAQSISSGEEFVARSRPELYAAIGSHFTTLDRSSRERLRQLLLGAVATDGLDHIPMFDSVRQPFSLSMHEILSLENRYGGIPFSMRPSRRLPPWIPVLRLEEMHALRRRGHALVVVSSRSAKLRWRGLAGRLSGICAGIGSSARGSRSDGCAGSRGGPPFAPAHQPGE